jgi:hypothetical protein
MKIKLIVRKPCDRPSSVIRDAALWRQDCCISSFWLHGYSCQVARALPGCASTCGGVDVPYLPLSASAPTAPVTASDRRCHARARRHGLPRRAERGASRGAVHRVGSEHVRGPSGLQPARRVPHLQRTKPCSYSFLVDQDSYTF